MKPSREPISGSQRSEILAARRVVFRVEGQSGLEHLNQQPTSFALLAEAVDGVRTAAETTIVASPEFQRLLNDV